MGRINAGRVIMGGLLAGLIINIVDFLVNGMMLKSQWESAMAELQLPPAGTGAIATFVIADFIVGILLVWLYAGLRPRCNPGPRTAVAAALTVWVFAYVFALLAPLVMGILPSDIVLILIIAGLIQLVLGGLAGAAVYREE